MSELKLRPPKAGKPADGSIERPPRSMQDTHPLRWSQRTLCHVTQCETVNAPLDLFDRYSNVKEHRALVKRVGDFQHRLSRSCASFTRRSRLAEEYSWRARSKGQEKYKNQYPVLSEGSICEFAFSKSRTACASRAADRPGHFGPPNKQVFLWSSKQARTSFLRDQSIYDPRWHDLMQVRSGRLPFE